MLEFPRHVLDALRQPMEDGHVTLARAAATLSYPARFTLVGAMNPCPCGRAGEPDAHCTCTPADVERYLARLSGPLADRVDMHIRVGAVPPRAIGARPAGEASAAIRGRVEAARTRQQARYAELPTVGCNAQASGRWLDRHGTVTAPARDLLVTAAERMRLSARGYFRVLKVARTIADLDGDAAVHPPHVAEALRSRPATPAAAGSTPARAPAAAMG
jgi:magnesium chelatase family protein